jgi:hypothetical protein
VLALQALSLDGLAAQYLKASLAAQPAQPELRFFLSQLEAGQGNVADAVYDAIKIVPDFPFHEFSELPREMWNLLFPRQPARRVSGDGLDTPRVGFQSLCHVVRRCPWLDAGVADNCQP